MSGTPSSSSSQAANETLSALERYQQHARQFAARWHDMGLYNAAAADFDAVRSRCRDLPPLSGAWVGLLIAHAELTQALWSAGGAPDPPLQERERLVQQVLSRARDLQHRCMDLVGPPER